MHPARDTETKEQTEEITNSISTPLPSKSNKNESAAREARGVETNEGKNKKYFILQKNGAFFSINFNGG